MSKHLQRTILLSATYRQSSDVTPDAAKLDPDNRLLAAARDTCCRPYVLRDQALAVSGTPGRKIIRPAHQALLAAATLGVDLQLQVRAGPWRVAVSPQPVHLLAADNSAAAADDLDAAEREVCVVRKDRTNTPLQALTLMNNVALRRGTAGFLPSGSCEGGATRRIKFNLAFGRHAGRRPRRRTDGNYGDAHESFLNRFQQDPQALMKLLATGDMPRSVSST